MKRLTVFLVLCSLPVLLISGCDDPLPDQPKEADAGTYALAARYVHIRSYPGGGGVFTVYIEPDTSFRGQVRLSLQCDTLLHPTVDRLVLDREHRVAEISIAPSVGSWTDSCVIEVRATHAGSTKSLLLGISMYHWEQCEPDVEMVLLDSFLTWQRTAHPEIGFPSFTPQRRYLTYPEHLIVEHWTFLDAVWELRLCRHVMIAPHNWSMMLLRPLGSLTPVLAARCESDGSIHEIPVSEYPVFYGY